MVWVREEFLGCSLSLSIDRSEKITERHVRSLMWGDLLSNERMPKERYWKENRPKPSIAFETLTREKYRRTVPPHCPSCTMRILLHERLYVLGVIVGLELVPLRQNDDGVGVDLEKKIETIDVSACLLQTFTPTLSLNNRTLNNRGDPHPPTTTTHPHTHTPMHT